MLVSALRRGKRILAPALLCTAVALAPFLVGCKGSPTSRAAEASATSTAAKAAATTTSAGRGAPEPPRAANLGPAGGKAGNVEYLEQMGGGAAPTDSVPLVVAVHGLGDRPENFSGLFRGFERPARFVFLRGLEPYHSGYSWFAFRTSAPDPELAPGIGDAADEIARAIGELVQQRPTLGKPIIVGFSQGGMLSFAVAARHPEVVRAALPIAGFLPAPLLPHHKPPALPSLYVFHGTADTVVPLERTQRTVKSLQALGFPVAVSTYPIRHTTSAQLRLDLFDRLYALLSEPASQH